MALGLKNLDKNYK